MSVGSEMKASHRLSQQWWCLETRDHIHNQSILHYLGKVVSCIYSDTLFADRRSKVLALWHRICSNVNRLSEEIRNFIHRLHHEVEKECCTLAIYSNIIIILLKVWTATLVCNRDGQFLQVSFLDSDLNLQLNAFVCLLLSYLSSTNPFLHSLLLLCPMTTSFGGKFA
jgi:hypothetical protein